MRTTNSPYFILICLTGLWTASAGQTLHLYQMGTHQTQVVAEVGDVVGIEARAQLRNFSASGLVVFMSIPSGPFEIIDAGFPAETGIQPFSMGPLFDGGFLMSNNLVSVSPLGDDSHHWLDCAVLLGTGSNRGRSGSGVVATFKIRCLAPTEAGAIHIDANPMRETRLVLADGISERRFTALYNMDITVKAPITAVEPTTWAGLKTHFQAR